MPMRIDRADDHRPPSALFWAGVLAGALVLFIGLLAASGWAGGAQPVAARVGLPPSAGPDTNLILSGSDVLKEPNAANLFLGAGPLSIDEVVTSVPAEGLGAFELHVTYDPGTLLVFVEEGPFLGSTGRSTSCTTVWNVGDLRFSCTSIGLQQGPTGSGVVATLTVYPHFDVTIRPVNNNGIKVMLDDVYGNTKLFDTAGQSITLRKAGDAKIILLALEGDLNSDCIVDTVDQDLILARLGAQKGSLLYNSFYDLQPWQKPDGDIDIQDVQVVTGRYLSTCDDPQGPQESPTPRPTLTPKATATVTQTPTATPEGPRFQKLPALINLFLTRQGDKIPPLQCVGPEGTSDSIELIETLSAPVQTNGQEIGGFEFELRYDSLKICIELRRGPAADENMACTIEDSITAPALQGIAHIRCVAKSKDVTGPNTKEEAGRQLAIIIVRPQPDLYSQIHADNSNGFVAQILNLGCKLFDLQGNIIPPYSCEDADVTIRFLEGDIEPDCEVNTHDTQLISFHFGSAQGSLLYLKRLDVSPRGGDGVIDINDVQFVSGRFGSSCTGFQQPPQPPMNPKA